MKQLHLYSIMPLDVQHVDEICEDIRRQYEGGVANYPLFCMTLSPEGTPPVNKAEILCQKYDLFREKLSAWGIPNGILVQATIGHGYVPNEMFPFQQYTNFSDGERMYVVCPYDEEFREYIFKAMQTVAAHQPDCIMVDDDLRLIGRSGSGCACPLHMKRFNELAGTNFNRETLADAVFSGAADSKRCETLFIETQREALVETAKMIRKGIDSINPAIPGSFCCVGKNAEFAAEIAEILAGAGNPTVVRINNGHYTAAGPRYFSDVFFRAAAQIAKLKDHVDVILAETDTCPQNRYSTSAMFLHTHFTGTILEGAMGAKHWITRLNAHEPQSGEAYRKILGRYRGFYQTLAEIVPSLKWRGCRIPVLREAVFCLKKGWNLGEDERNGWAYCVLERLGLPMYFSGDHGGVLCLEGAVDQNLSDEEVLEALKGPVFLASDAAAHLVKRGFGKYLGVDVRDWVGKQPSGEKLLLNGNEMGAQVQIKEIIPASPSVEVDSMVYHSVDGVHEEELFPGTTIYKNELGGMVVVFSGTPKTNYNYVEAFSFLNCSRKQQLIKMLEQTEELPVYYPNDEEIYFRAADLPDGNLLCAVFNLGFDPIEQLELVCRDQIQKIEQLMPDGTWNEAGFAVTDGRCRLEIPCDPVTPVVLRLQRGEKNE